jgi:death-on-curing family protein
MQNLSHPYNFNINFTNNETRMNRLTKEMREEFQRGLAEFDNSEVFDRHELSYADVLFAHFLVADYFRKSGERVLYGLKNPTLMGSAIGRQRTSWEGRLKWTDSTDITATLFFGLVKNHAFHDGNKRTALLCLLYQLFKNGRTPTCKQTEFEDFTVAIARSDYSRLVYHDKPIEDDQKKLCSFPSSFVQGHVRSINDFMH